MCRSGYTRTLQEGASPDRGWQLQKPIKLVVRLRKVNAVDKLVGRHSKPNSVWIELWDRQREVTELT